MLTEAESPAEPLGRSSAFTVTHFPFFDRILPFAIQLHLRILPREFGTREAVHEQHSRRVYGEKGDEPWHLRVQGEYPHIEHIQIAKKVRAVAPLWEE